MAPLGGGYFLLDGTVGGGNPLETPEVLGHAREGSRDGDRDLELCGPQQQALGYGKAAERGLPCGPSNL